MVKTFWMENKKFEEIGTSAVAVTDKSKWQEQKDRGEGRKGD
jgi:hypothetical protein